MAGGLATLCIILCIVGATLSGAAWAVMGATQNPYGTLAAKKGFVLSLFGALVIASASALVAFFVHIGNGIH